MECRACSENIIDVSDSIACNGACRSLFHFACGGFGEKQFRKLTALRKSKWTCLGCSSSTNLMPKDASNTELSKQSSEISDTTASQQVSDSNNALNTIVNQQTLDIKDFVSTKLEEFKKYLEFNNSLIQDLKVAVDNLQITNIKLQEQSQELVKENVEMKKEIKDLKLEVIELKQYSRRTNIEITNIPETPDEDISQLLAKIGEISDCNLSENTVIAHRIPSYNKDRPKPIVVQLTSKPVKDILLKKLKDRKIKSSEISPRFKEFPVYFNEHLAPELKKLFYQARKFKTDNEFTYCWVRDGKIFLRKDQSSKIFRIKSEEDLNIPLAH